MFHHVKAYFRAFAEEYGRIRQLEDRILRF